MWLIEERIFEPSAEAELDATLQRRGAATFHFRGMSHLVEEMLREMTGLHASCWFVTQAAKSKHWPRHQWGLPEDFAVASYWPKWQSWLLNAEAESFSLAEFVWTADTIWQRWGNDAGSLFVRPDDGFKTFTGSLLSRTALEEWWLARQAFLTPHNTRLWVARPQTIHAEYRCFVAESRVVTGSQYRPMIDSHVPIEVVKFVESVLREVSPTMSILAVDVAVTDRGWRIVEIGCVPCLDFYAANLDRLTCLLETR